MTTLIDNTINAADVAATAAALTKPRRLHPRDDDDDDECRASPPPRYAPSTRVRWPVYLLPADVEVSFGWEQEQEKDHAGKGGAESRDITLSPTSSGGSGGDSDNGKGNERSSHSTPRTSASQSPSLGTHSCKLISPATQVALLIRSHSQGWARSFELHRQWPRPTSLAPDEVLVRNVASGLNPVDFKSLLYKFGIERFPWVLGRDVCGVVKIAGSESGDAVAPPPSSRVWTCSDSRDVRAGAYQAYSVHKAFTLGTLPDSITDEEAATIGTGLVTAGVALYWFFGLPKPAAAAGGGRQSQFPRSSTAPQVSTTTTTVATPWLLIYGGGAITGIYAAQLAHLSGVRVVSVASPENFEYLKSIGVDVCVNRHADSGPEDILRQVQEAVGADGNLLYALDCVGSATATLCHRALLQAANTSSASPTATRHLIALAGNPKQQRGEDNDAASAAVTTHRISFSTTFYGHPPFTRSFLDAVYTLLSSGALKPARPTVVPHGLAGVRNGLEQLRDGTVPRARKLVVRVDDTPEVEATNLGIKQDLGWNGCV